MVINGMKSILKKSFAVLGLHLSRASIQKEHTGTIEEISSLFQFVLEKNGGGESRSQLNQDVFALIANNFKRDGFFVEFGATDGVLLSNSYLLEKNFGWRGILAEPARMWQENLKKNRDCAIETDCVWTTTGETLDFDMTNEGEFSTLSDFAVSDHHLHLRKKKTTYAVKTISLFDLLRKYHAPSEIDYLSIDTEGSELKVLESFDFSAYRFNVISVEHNYTPNRENIRSLLERNGYKRVFKHLSKWDDWYVSGNESA